MSDLTREDEWLALRSLVVPPQLVSELVTTDRDRREFLRGAELLRFHGPLAMRGRRVQPQQLLVADVLAAGREQNAFELPRRSSKSTSLIAVGLGRAEAREDYRVAILTMTTGKAGRSRFLKDVVPALDRHLVGLEGAAPFKIVKSAGMEGVTFHESGGMVQWLSSVDDFRGEAYDMVLLDEGGEPDPQKVEDTLAAALPTTDTREEPQVIVAGTAGRYRTGNLLWMWLELLRTGAAGGAAYHLPETLQDEDLESWDRLAPMIAAAHPGVGTLTTLDSLESKFLTLPRATFLAEYGGVFGDEGGTVSLFDPVKWARTGRDDDPSTVSPPERWSIAFAPHPDQLTVSITAAWRDETGKAVPLLLDRIEGIDGAAPALIALWRKHRRPIVYDGGSQVAQLIVEKIRLNRAVRVDLLPYTFGDVKRAASLVVDEVDRENVNHWSRQVELNEAIHRTVKRKSGDRGWLLGRHPKRPQEDITAAEAWSMAQLHYDTTKPRAKTRGRVAS